TIPVGSPAVHYRWWYHSSHFEIRSHPMRRRRKTGTPIEDAPHLRSGDKEVERIQKQLELFNAVTFGRQDKDDFSNVIDLYDILPRYAQVQNVSDDEENLIRRVRHRGSEYVMEVAPARLGSG